MCRLSVKNAEIKRVELNASSFAVRWSWINIQEGPNKFFGIPAFPYLKLGIRNFKTNGKTRD